MKNKYILEIKTTLTKEYHIEANNLEEAYDKIDSEGIAESNTKLLTLKHEICYDQPIFKNGEYLRDKDGMVLSLLDINRRNLKNY